MLTLSGLFSHAMTTPSIKKSVTSSFPSPTTAIAPLDGEICAQHPRKYAMVMAVSIEIALAA
jgi:hypothetical protein